MDKMKESLARKINCKEKGEECYAIPYKSLDASGISDIYNDIIEGVCYAQGRIPGVTSERICDLSVLSEGCADILGIAESAVRAKQLFEILNPENCGGDYLIRIITDVEEAADVMSEALMKNNFMSYSLDEAKKIAGKLESKLKGCYCISFEDIDSHSCIDESGESVGGKLYVSGVIPGVSDKCRIQEDLHKPGSLSVPKKMVKAKRLLEVVVPEGYINDGYIVRPVEDIEEAKTVLDALLTSSDGDFESTEDESTVIDAFEAKLCFEDVSSDTLEWLLRKVGSENNWNK